MEDRKNSTRVLAVNDGSSLPLSSKDGSLSQNVLDVSQEVASAIAAGGDADLKNKLVSSKNQSPLIGVNIVQQGSEKSDLQETQSSGASQIEYSSNKTVPEKPSYASAAKRRGLPTFQQSVVIDAIEGITNDVYMDCFEKIMSINKLRYFSKISDNRVCFTLNSENSAKELLDKVLIIQGQALKFRPFDLGQNVYKYKRIVISNILPQIPNDVIIDHLKTLGVFTKNGITNIRCSSSIELRKHVQSHRRQFYVKEEDVKKIPAKIKIVFCETPFWIFLGADDIKCHYCKNVGHIAKYCPQLLNSKAPLPNTQPEDENTHLNEQSEVDGNSSDFYDMDLSHPVLSPTQEGDEFYPPLPGVETAIDSLKLKRPAPSSLNSSSTTHGVFKIPASQDTGNKKKVKGRKSKKVKTAPSVDSPHTSDSENDVKKTRSPPSREAKKFKTGDVGALASSFDSESSEPEIDWFNVNNISDDLNSLKALYDDPNVQAPLDFDNLVKYFIESKGKRNIIEFTEKFTNDVPGLISFFEIAKNLLKVKYNSNKMSNLIKRLKKGVDSGSWPSKATAVD